MAKKPAIRSQKSQKPGKAASISPRKVSGSKKPALAKPVKTQAAKTKPGKIKSIDSKPAPSTIKSSSSKVAPKLPAVPRLKDNTEEPAIPSVLDYQEQRARIARRAYELYEERCPHGADVQDWLRAEREIMQKP